MPRCTSSRCDPVHEKPSELIAASPPANLGVQPMGGHGYIREDGMGEQKLVRDGAIAQIYECQTASRLSTSSGASCRGTTGRLLRRFFHPVDRLHHEHKIADAAEFGRRVEGALSCSATVLVAAARLKNPDESGAGASDYLKLFALTALAFHGARMATLSLLRRRATNPCSTRASSQTARSFWPASLPEPASLLTIISAGAQAAHALEGRGPSDLNDAGTEKLIVFPPLIVTLARRRNALRFSSLRLLSSPLAGG